MQDFSYAKVERHSRKKCIPNLLKSTCGTLTPVELWYFTLILIPILTLGSDRVERSGMQGLVGRAFAVIELLAEHPGGISVSEIAKKLGLPASGVHRLLKELIDLGYVRQPRAQGDYQLSIKLPAIGLGFLSSSGIPDISQPTLDDLAFTSKELVRMSFFDGTNLVWVGFAQGATSGLRYDPGREHGASIPLTCTASGLAWLSAFSNEEALNFVSAQGLHHENTPRGTSAPQTINELLSVLEATRKRGYSISTNTFIAGMAAMAAAIHGPQDEMPIGTVSIAGPSIRMTAERIAELGEPLVKAAHALSRASVASSYIHGSERADHAAAN
ncbi:MAG: IclR family transcriptional regulator [Rhizobiaceae bacterium]|nr:IclR family transcriptional regulator [Rhizobiaceae bacterium]